MENPWWSPSLVNLNEKPLVEFLFTKFEGRKAATFFHEVSSPCWYYRESIANFPINSFLARNYYGGY